MDFERKLTEVGNSLAILIPSDLAKYFELEKGSEVLISDDDDKIVIRKNVK